jgi:hypothetical protein
LQPDLIKRCFEDLSAQKKQFTIEKSPLGPYVGTNGGLFLPDSEEEEESADPDYIINIQQHVLMFSIYAAIVSDRIVK